MKSRILIVLLAAAFVLIAVPTASFAQPPPRHEVHVTLNDVDLEGCNIDFWLSDTLHSIVETDEFGIAWIQLAALPESWRVGLDSRCVGPDPSEISQTAPGNVHLLEWNVAGFEE